jgi:uncharacterized DUF497 family protein
MKFDWDDEKALANIQKHDVCFEIASRVFLDPNRIEKYDANHADIEDRWQSIGMVRMSVLMVVHTERGEDGNIIRLISARKANEKERKAYYSLRD